MKKKKTRRVKEEINRISQLFENVPEDKQKLVSGLIERAAFMRAELEDLEVFLAENGWTESFQQSERVPPYDRARPQGQTYATLASNYQKIIKQLSELAPEKPAEVDELLDFIK